MALSKAALVSAEEAVNPLLPHDLSKNFVLKSRVFKVKKLTMLDGIFCRSAAT
jgi:hypothetical protein